MSEIKSQIDAHPEIWDEYTFRTDSPNSPHREVSDIWVRYNKIENLGSHFNDEHEAVWYPVLDKIPAIENLCDEMMEVTGTDKLGGVLITCIPPGKQVYPHSDHGWHAETYDKFAILIEGNAEQSFCFDDMEHRCSPGDSFTFKNQYRHWVKNPTEIPRMTLIICAGKSSVEG